MKTNAVRIRFVLITVVTGLLVAISGAAQDHVKIGAIYSLTGPAPGIAKLQKSATELAIKEVNDTGGIDLAGKKVKLEGIFADDMGNPQNAAVCFRNLVKNDRVVAILGGSAAPVVLALNTAAKRNPALFIATCLVPENLHQHEVKAETALSILGAASDIGRSGGSYLAEKVKPKKIACIVPSMAFANSAVAGFESVIKKYPEIEYEVFAYPSASIFKIDLQQVRDFKPDIVATWSWGGDQTALCDQVLGSVLAKETKCFHFLTGSASGSRISTETTERIRAQMIWHYDMSGCTDQAIVKASDEFTSKFRETYNELPDAHAMAAYSAVKEIVRGIELCQSTNPVRIYASLMANPVWIGIKGEAKWRKDGRCMYKYFDWIVEAKVPDERKEGASGGKYDYARVVDVFTGDAFAPTLQELGY